MANINVTVSAYNANKPYASADTYTLADTGANIAALSAADFADLGANGIAKINATDNVLSLSVAQYQALGDVTLAAGDVITLADTGTDIAALSATDIAGLADAGIDKIDASDNALSLTVAQYQALGTVALSSGDTVTLTGTGATLSALLATDIAALAAAGVDQLDATNNVLSLTLAQYQALGTVTVAANDILTLSGTGASIGALSVAQIAGLAASGFDKINATDNVLTLSVAQYQALGTVQLVAGDVITLGDTGANIAALSATAFAALADAGIDKIDATDNALNLTVAQFEGLGTVELAGGDVITLADSGANIAALSAATLATLGSAGVDAINAGDDALSLSVAQAQALGSVSLTAADTLTLADTGANLAALTPAELAQLASAGFDALDASDGALTLSLAQIDALGTMALTLGNTVVAEATMAQIAALSTTEIAALGDAGVDLLGPSDGQPAVSVAQARAILDAGLWFTGNTAVLSDSSTAIETLDGAALEDFYLRGIAQIDASDNVLALSVEQILAVDNAGTDLTAADVVTLADSSTALAALSANTIDALAHLGVDKIDATDNLLSLTVAQVEALGTIALIPADTITLADSAAHIEALTANQIGTLAGLGIDTIHATGGSLSLTVAQAQALGSVGLTAADTVTLADTAAHIQALTANQIAALATAGIDTIDSSTDALSLTAAQAEALGTIGLGAGDVATLADTGANIAALSATTLAALVASGIDAVNASDDALALTVAQAQALASVPISGTDTITLADTGGHIAALTTAEFAALAARGFAAIDATDNTLTLSLEQAQGLGGLALTAGDLVTVEATGAQFAALTAQDFTDLAALGVDALSTTDHTLSLTIAQLDALGGLALAADDTVTLADTGANLAALSTADITALAGLGIDTIHATGGTLSLTVAQTQALGSVGLTAADTVTLADTAAHIQALTASEIAALATAGIDTIDSGTDALSLTAAQAQALGTIGLAAGDVVTLADTGAHIAALSATTLTALVTAGIDAVNASNDALALTVGQVDALASVNLTAGDTITLADTSAQIAALSTTALAALAGRGIDAIDATDDELTLSLAQVQALGSVALTAGDLVTVVATGTQFAALTAQNFADLAAIGVDALATTDHALTLTVAQAQALGGLTLAQGDTVTLADPAATIDALSPSDLADLVALGVDEVIPTSGVLELSAAQAVALSGATLAQGGIVSDSGAALAALDPAQWATLAAMGTSVIQVTDDIVTLDVAQTLAMGTLGLSVGDALILADSGANISALAPSQLSALADKGNYIELDATDNVLVFDYAQFYACRLMVLTNDDAVTIVDTAQNLNGLDAQDIAWIAARGAINIAATEGTLVWSLEQVQALGTMYIADGTVAMVQVTPAELANLTPQDLADLADQGIDMLAGVDGVLSLDLTQLNALGSIELIPADTVSLVLTPAELAGLAPADLPDLAGLGIDVLDLGSQGATITLDQVAALGSLTIAAPQLTLEDTAGLIANRGPAQLAALGDLGVTHIHAVDGTLWLDVDQMATLHAAGVTLDDDDGVVLFDSADALAALSVVQIAALGSAGFTAIEASDAQLTLSLEQAQALGNVMLGDGQPVVVTGSGAALGVLSTADLADLAASGVDRIDATDDVLGLSLAQLAALDTVALTASDTVTLEAAGTALAALSPSELADLVGRGIDVITLSDGATALSLDQLRALDGANFAGAGTVTLTADSATVAAMSDNDIALLRFMGLTGITVTDHDLSLSVLKAYELSGLAWDAQARLTLVDDAAIITDLLAENPDDFHSLPVVSLDATDDIFTLSLAQLAAIEGITIGADDYIVIADTGAHLAALTSADIDALAARKVVEIDATDGALTLSLDTWASYRGNQISFTQDSHVVVADSGAALAQFSNDALAALGDSGVTRFDASDDVLVLSYDQLQLLDEVTLTAQDTVKVWFDGDTLATLTTDDIATLVAAGVDMVTALAPSLTIDLPTLGNLTVEGLALDPETVVRLVLDAEVLASIPAEALPMLAELGIDVVHVSGELSLSAEQFAGLGAMELEAGDGLNLVDTGATIAALSPEALAALADRGVGMIDATDGVVHLTLDQLGALGSIHVAGNDLAVADLTAQQATDFNNETRALLGLHGIDAIAVTQGTLSLGLADLARYTDFPFVGGNVVLAESGTTLGGLSAYDFADLAQRGITALDATDDALVLSLAQFVALGAITLTSADDVTVIATAADLAAQSPSVYAAMSASGVDNVEVSGGALQLSAAQAAELGNVQLSSSAAITLVDTGAAIAALNADTIGGLSGSGVTAIDVTTGITINAVKYEALGGIGFALSNVVTVASNHSFTMGADVDNVTLSGTKNLVVTGNGGANVITGNAGRNTLDGGAGNDRLIGGAGRDVLTGGAGADKFIFRDGDFGGNTATTADRITDFSHGSKDLISLIGVDANSNTVGDDGFAWIGASAFHAVAGELRFAQVSGNTYVQGDTNGDGVSDFWIRLDGLVNLQASDFQL